MSETEAVNPMREPRIEKVVVHMGVGEGGRALQNAEGILEAITGQESVRTTARETIPEWGIRAGQPIGAKVTLRGEAAHDFLETALPLATIRRSQFDRTGNVSFGLPEHTAFPTQEYNPNIGIFGLDVTVTLVRPGYRVHQRDRERRSIPSGHRLRPDDAIHFLERTFEVTVG